MKVLKLSLFLSCQWLSRQGFLFSSGENWRAAGMPANLASSSPWGSFGHWFPGPPKPPMPRQVWKSNCTNPYLWFVSSDAQMPWRRRYSLHSVLNRNILSCFIPFSINSQMKASERKNTCEVCSSFSSAYISQINLQTLLNTFWENSGPELYCKVPLQRWGTKPHLHCKVYHHRHLPCWVRRGGCRSPAGSLGMAAQVTTATG